MPTLHRSESIRQFILAHINDHHGDITRLTTGQFGVSRQMVARYLRALTDEGLLEATGNTKGRSYRLRPLVDEAVWLDVTPDFDEAAIWRQELAPLLGSLPANVAALCQHGVTAMIANVRDHSGSGSLYAAIARNALNVTITIGDFGVGIMERIQRDLGLADLHDAPLELIKGWLGASGSGHSGNSMVLTARLFDRFSVASGPLALKYTAAGEHWQLGPRAESTLGPGTVVVMELALATSRTVAEALAHYAADYGSAGAPKTLAPVQLAQHGAELLVSRSQARRVLARLDRFSDILLDFWGVPTIGQAFADEIFRVFRNERPQTGLAYRNASPDVERMIAHVTPSPVM